MRPTSPSFRRRARWRRRPQLGLVLRRDPRAWWAVVLSLALSLGTVTSVLVGRAEAARHRWGVTQEVLVAERDLVAGERLGPADVTLERRPAALVPSSALRSLPDGATARAMLLAGEVVVSERLAPSGLRGVAALLPSGTRAISIPTEPGSAPPVARGDHVEVLVALATESADGAPPGFSLVSDALVVAVDDDSVTVAVPRDAAPRVAVALAVGAVTLALIGA